MDIILKDGTTYEGASNSTTTEFIIFVADIDAFAAEYKKMTDENLSRLTVGDTTVVNRTLSETKTYKYADKLEAHFVVLPSEAQTIIEEMEQRAEVNQDKADGYDILTGGI